MRRSGCFVLRILGLVGTLFIAWLASAGARCPNWCNQRGICTSPSEGGHCYCDMGYTGEDCSQHICPKAFEPLTLGAKTSRRSVRLLTGHQGGVLGGRMELSFGPSSVILPASAHELSTEDCTRMLSRLKTVSSILCQRERFNETDGTGAFLITLLSFPLRPFENNHFTHDGNPPGTAFRCNSTRMDVEDAIDPYCEIQDAEAFNIVTEAEGGPGSMALLPAYTECSSHGMCDRSTGLCKCARGFKGVACNDTRDAQDIEVLEHDGPFFEATLMKLHVIRDPSDDFTVFQARINHQNVTSIKGSRLLEHAGDANVLGNLHVGYLPTATDSSVHSRKSLIDLTFNSSSTSSSTTFSSSARFLLHARDLVAPLRPVFTVTEAGDLSTAGDLIAANGSFVVASQHVMADNLLLRKNLHVLGSTLIEKELTVGRTLIASEVGVEISASAVSPTTSGDSAISRPVLRLSGTPAASANVKANGDIELSLDEADRGTRQSPRVMLEIESSEEHSSMLRTVSNGLVTFELMSEGDVTMRGLRLLSGGVEVVSGGLTVEAGGLRVKGGLVVESGALNVSDATLVATSFHAANTVEYATTPLFQATTTTSHYAGVAVDLSVSSVDTHSFDFLRATAISTSDGQAKPVMSIKGDGSIHTEGQLSVQGHDGLSVAGSAALGGLSLTQHRIPAGESIVIPALGTYFVIENDGVIAANQLSFARESLTGPRTTPLGRMVLITNDDAQATVGGAAIPPLTTAIFVFDGSSYVDVQALRSPIRELTGIRAFQAAADLDVGNFSLTAGQLRASRLTRGRVPVVGAGGLLQDSDRLTYRQGVLRVPSIQAKKLIGDWDAKGSQISSLSLLSPRLNAADISAASLTIPGHRGIAFFTSSGELQASAALRVSTDGTRVEVRELHNDLHMNSYRIVNVTVEHSQLNHVTSASIERLWLSSRPSQPGRGAAVLTVQLADGEVVASSAITVDPVDASLHVNAMHGYRLLGDIHAAGQRIHEATLQGGQLTAISSVSTEVLYVTSLAADASSKQQQKPQRRLLVADETGKITSMKDSSVPLELSGMNVAALRLAGSMDAAGQVIKNARLDPESTVYGTLPRLDVQELTLDPAVTAQQPRKESTELSLTGLLANGTLRSVPTAVLRVQDKLTLLTVDEVFVTSLSLRTSRSTVRRTEPNRVLVLDSEDRVIPASSAEPLDLGGVIFVNGSLHLPPSSFSDASLHLPSCTTALLATDASGRVISAGDAESTLRVKALAGSSASFREISSEQSRTAALYLTHSPEDGMPSDVSRDSAVLVRDKRDGAVRASSALSVDRIDTRELSVIADLRAQAIYLPALPVGSGQRLLLLEESGRLSATSATDLALGSLSVKQLQAVEASITQLRWNPNSEQRGTDIAEQSSSSRVLVAAADGLLTATSELALQTVTAEEMTVGQLTAHQLRVTSLARLGAGAVDAAASEARLIVAAEDGSLQGTDRIHVAAVTTAQLQADVVTAGQLIISPSPSSASGMTTSAQCLVVADGRTGVVRLETVETFLADVMQTFATNAETAASKVAATTVSSLNVTENLHVHRLRLRTPMSSPSGVAGTRSIRSLVALAEDGTVLTVGTDDTVDLPSILVSEDATVQGTFSARRIVLSDGTPSASIDALVDGPQALIGFDATSRELRPLPPHSLLFHPANATLETVYGHFTSSIVTHSAAIHEISSDVQWRQHRLVDARLVNASVEARRLRLLDVSSEPVTSVGRFLYADDSGDVRVSPASAISADSSGRVSIHNASVHHLQAASASLSEVHIESGDITSASLRSIRSLEVQGMTELMGDTYVDGTLTVRGAVIGSGPYIDSSDRRLKKNIKPLNEDSGNERGTLDKITQLRGVTYDHRVEEFPERKLDPRPQIGWLADEVQAVFPELVATDAEGMQGVSYSRAVVLLAQAMKEMQAHYEQRIARLEAACGLAGS